MVNYYWTSPTQFSHWFHTLYIKVIERTILLIRPVQSRNYLYNFVKRRNAFGHTIKINVINIIPYTVVAFNLHFISQNESTKMIFHIMSLIFKFMVKIMCTTMSGGKGKKYHIFER